MDLTNRVLIIGGALLWIFLVMVVILLAWGAPDESIRRLDDLAGFMADHNDSAAKLIITFGGLILALLAVIVIIFEVAPPQAGSLKVERIGAGEVRIGTDEIAHRLEEELRALPQISQIQANVLARGQKAEVNLDLHVGAEADLAATVEEACRRARATVEERIGVALAGPPQVRLHYRELRVARGQKPSPAATPPPPSPAQQSRPSGLSSSEATGPAPAGTPPVTEESAHETSETSQEDRPAGG